jgi:hypothetical protein
MKNAKPLLFTVYNQLSVLSGDRPDTSRHFSVIDFQAGRNSAKMSHQPFIPF